MLLFFTTYSIWITLFLCVLCAYVLKSFHTIDKKKEMLHGQHLFLSRKYLNLISGIYQAIV